MVWALIPEENEDSLEENLQVQNTEISALILFVSKDCNKCSAG